jgi:hypothetical protein
MIMARTGGIRTADSSTVTITIMGTSVGIHTPIIPSRTIMHRRPFTKTTVLPANSSGNFRFRSRLSRSKALQTLSLSCRRVLLIPGAILLSFAPGRAAPLPEPKRQRAPANTSRYSSA